ncbi:hypothetical protein RFI_29171 [Reticulomyxa filosa]|uniref:Uncharacterized protein n=1 Tax=Reticulomyxa filosa TaxID=46433 RepID=X6M3L0_RETFI|nr:hypothetical protein RFI_29171 [Reticulomyxa filosa]|eukprot:ETO08216.1 hypothetical protein RFI_29171 [Reticulomyxa filosa]
MTSSLSDLSLEHDAPPSEVDLGLSQEHEQELELQREVRKLEQELMSKTIAHDILSNRLEMLEKRLETKELRIKNLMSDINKIQIQITQKKENEIRMKEKVQEIKTKVKIKNKEEAEKEEDKQQMENNILQMQQKLQGVDKGVEKMITEFAQSINYFHQATTQMQQNNEKLYDQIFNSIHQNIQNTNQEIQQLFIKQREREKEEKQEYNNNNNNNNNFFDDINNIELWNEKWNDIFQIKNICDDIHGQCLQLPNQLAPAKSIKDLTAFIQEYKYNNNNNNNNNNEITLKDWMKHQLSVIQSTTHHVPHVRHILLTLLCRTFVIDLTLETKLFEIQFKAEQFIQNIIHKELANQISEDTIHWCRDLIHQNISTHIFISPKALPQSIYFFFENTS